MAGIRRSLDKRLGVALGAALALYTLCIALACTMAWASPPRYELVEKFGPDGSASSGFVRPGPVAVDQQTHFVYVAADQEGGPGSLYKFDSNGTPVSWGGSEPYIFASEISGIELPSETERQVAVDSTSHLIYVTSNNSIRAFQADGEPSEFTAGPGAGSSSIDGFVQLSGVAVDVNGNIYASDRTEGVVKIFASSGEQVNEFSVENAANLAVDSAGAVYVTRAFSTVIKFTPSSFPVTGATTYAEAAEPVDPNGSYTVGVNPATNDVYIVHLSSGVGVAVYAADGTPITTFGEPGSDGNLNIADGIAIDGSNTRVYIGNQPPSGGGEPAQVYVFQPEPPAAPTIENVTVSKLTNTSATLNARINPEQKETTYWFEYGLADCSVSVCTTVPVGGASILAGNDGVWVSQNIQGLSAGTEYHYRVVAENELGPDEKSGKFTTPGNIIGFQLADRRAWEMVSPPNKRGALLKGPGVGLVQAAFDGDGIAYVSNGSVEADPKGSRELQAILAQRGTAGWGTQDITPPTGVATPPVAGANGEYKLFSPDLSKAILDPRSDTALSPEASERTPYLRENTDPPSYRPLVTGKEEFANVPPGTQFGGSALLSEVLIRDASPDLSHVVVSSGVPLVEVPLEGAPSQSLYAWADGQLEPISILPGGELVFASFPGSGEASMRNSISDDGSRVFWTGPSKHLYMRDMEAGETVQLDQVQPPASGDGKVEPMFQGASADGSVVFFTDFQQLTEDSGASYDEASGNGNADLYQCEIVQTGSTSECELRDLTPKVGSEVADVQGLVSAISEDGSAVYFVARGSLSTQPNQSGDVATSGQPNMYLWEEGKGVRFIATLSSEDRADWGLAGGTAPPGGVARLGAAASPSGRYLAFMSERNLTEQESIDVSSKEAVERVFRYDADADRLDCVSCSPNGSAPEGAVIGIDNPLVDPNSFWSEREVAALLPQPVRSSDSTTIYQPRAMLDNGRVFFNAIDSLVSSDSNGQWDVYQFEPTGVGDCSSSSGGASISRSGDGCISLISSGTGEEEAGFLDASETGDDVFFLTPARLAVTDVDDELDIYDARVDGTTAVQAPPPADCSGESCRSAGSQGSDAPPASASFSGPGNVKSGKKCAKGKRKVKQGGKQRCVAKKQKQNHRRASHNGRAHR